MNNLAPPDMLMDQINARIIDDTGKVNMTMTASKMLHYSVHNITEFTQPLVTIYQQEQMPWIITAGHATSYQGMQKIYLWEHVVIKKNSSIDPATLITDKLWLFPEHKLAKTSAAVTITQPNTSLTAVGFNADLNLGTIQLLSQVKGKYLMPLR
jgi:LPS export ABC transporter protein LptC